MRDLDHAQSLIKAVVAAVSVPVTLKMRLGWDHASRNASELARRAEAEGVKLLTVHGRTRCQFFTGSADWSAVAPVVEATSLPVLVNGDILNPGDARAALMASGAAGVMIGRGAYGAPWMPGRVAATLSTGRDPGEPDRVTQRAIALEHVEAMFIHYGGTLGIKNARKHIGWYLTSSGCADADMKVWRRRLCTEWEPARVLSGLSEFYDNVEAIAA
jgi:nifR3 family TIM-barrel protein